MNCSSKNSSIGPVLIGNPSKLCLHNIVCIQVDVTWFNNLPQTQELTMSSGGTNLERKTPLCHVGNATGLDDSQLSAEICMPHHIDRMARGQLNE